MLYVDILSDKLTEPVTVEDWVTYNWPNQDKSARKDIKVDGVNAVIFDGGNVEPKSNKYMFIIKGNDFIQISAHYLNFLTNQGGGKNPYYDQTKNLWINNIDQILSTFKFVDQTNQISCTNDSDCGVNICDCKADLEKNILVKDKICTRYCPGIPKCIDSKCVLIK